MAKDAAQTAASVPGIPNVTLSYDAADLTRFYQDLLSDTNDGKVDQVKRALVEAIGKIERQAREKGEQIARMYESKGCTYCHGTGFVDHVVGGERLGVRKCTHSAPQGEMPF